MVVPKIDLSLVIITLNEQDCIGRCINSVPFASEVIVVDSGSTDKTIEIAKSLGAKVFQNEWKGFGAQKAFAVEKATHGWMLSLDADEWLSDELQKEIVNVVENSGLGHRIFAAKRLSRYLGEWIYHGGWYPDWQVRLFKKGAAEWDASQTIHESLRTSSKSALLSGILYHEPFKDIKEQVDVNFKYAGLLAEKKFAEGRRVKCPFSIIFKTLFRFKTNYIFKGGFRDGLRGFIIAWNSAQSYMVQLYEIYKRTKR
ncbi:MAG: glycosyltransferase family 2 protein [Pseudomonadota bacterium]